jgi:hypothetical protein
MPYLPSDESQVAQLMDDETDAAADAGNSGNPLCLLLNQETKRSLKQSLVTVSILLHFKRD